MGRGRGSGRYVSLTSRTLVAAWERPALSMARCHIVAPIKVSARHVLIMWDRIDHVLLGLGRRSGIRPRRRNVAEFKLWPFEKLTLAIYLCDVRVAQGIPSVVVSLECWCRLVQARCACQMLTKLAPMVSRPKTSVLGFMLYLEAGERDVMVDVLLMGDIDDDGKSYDEIEM